MVVGKLSRTKSWVSGQIESFSDFEGGGPDGGDSDDSESQDGNGNGNGNGAVNGHKNGDEDQADGEGSPLAGADPAKHWDKFEDLARRSTLTSRISVRTRFLNDVLLKQLEREAFTPAQLSAILKLLLPTYARYIDAGSRSAVLACVVRIVETDLSAGEGKLADGLVKWLDNEIRTKASQAAGSNIIGLLFWTLAVFGVFLKQYGPDALIKGRSATWASLVRTLALSVDALQASNIKGSAKRGGIATLRRFLRNNATTIPGLLKQLTGTSEVKPASAAATLLGEVAGTSMRLRRSRGQPADRGTAWVMAEKEAILSYYRDNILASRTSLPSHVILALNDFVGFACGPEDLQATAELAKALEKALLRTPEVALTTVDVFFTAYISPVSLAKEAPAAQRLPPQDLVQQKLLPSILAASKSSSPLTRSSAALLFNTLATPFLNSDDSTSDILSALAREPGSLLKTNKTASPEHRIALCQMLASLTYASAYHSSLLVEICDAISGSLAKETNEAALKASLQTMTSGLLPLLVHDSDKVKSVTSTFLKGMQDGKPNLRRQYLGGVADLLWRVSANGQEATAATKDFAKSSLPGFEAALKNATGSATASAVEGWLAVAVIKGPLASWGVADAVISKNPALQSLLATAPKPSFLLAEKGYRKLANPDDEIWLVRALQSVLIRTSETTKLWADAGLRLAVGAPLLHVALDSQYHEHRKLALKAVTDIVIAHEDGRASSIFTESLQQWLVQAEHQDALKATVEDAVLNPDRPARLQALAAAIGRASVKHETVLCQLLVLSHHSFMARSKGSYWIDIVLAGQRDPQALVTDHLEDLLSRIWHASAHTSQLFRAAAYKSIATLTFVAPETLLPKLLERVQDYLSPDALSFVGPTELGILATLEGQTFVDVLSTNKGPTNTSKGKNAAIDKWDQEMRASLAAKKRTGAAAPVLSKADKALVDAQLAKETAIRARITDKLNDIRQACLTIQALLTAQTDVIAAFVPGLLAALLAAVRAPNCALYAEDVFQTILRLYESCTSRVSDIRLSLALAVLRGEDSPVVPEDFSAEPLATLVTRVLYRLRFQSEQKPFDSSSFALATPLLRQCIEKEGLGVEKGDTDAAMEQLALAIDVIAFHVRQFADQTFPRLQIIDSLISALLRYPSMARQATDALVDLGQAIEANATSTEIQALLSGLLVDEAQVRHACLQALVPLDLTEMDYSDSLWIAVQDADERNAKIALNLWEENGLDVRESSITTLLPFLNHKSTFVRVSSALAIADAVGQLPQSAKITIDLLARDYREAARERLPEYDRFGMLIEASLEQQDPWQHRVAIAETLGHMSEIYGSEEVVAVFKLLIQEQALGDRFEIVQSKMLNAGVAAVDSQGKQNLQSLMELFQNHLSNKQSSKATEDRITESVIVLLGRLARHLEPSDPRVVSVTDRLLLALRTPSELVQVAVSDCLPPLISANREKGASVIEQLLRETLQSTKYAERRGAAYGLAGAIKGRGLTALKEFDVVSRLTDATEDKKNVNARQGAVFAFETLSGRLGRLFEPYMIKIIPLLLVLLGDTSVEVREATAETAKVVMSRVSGHAVKLILPSLLDALEDRQWRTKKGAIELLGTMAYLAPKQLSQSLPAILPPLTNVLTDTHTQVRAAANASLKKFGEVVSNPEIQAMQSTLLGALVDPTKKTNKALDVLLTTSFVHYIDTSSLALIVPIIDRGLRERGTELKRKGAQIVGNLASLTDSKDLISYLPQLIPRVQEVLIDPVPEARATAAKSLGVLIERLGEDAFPTLVEELMATLKSDLSGVDQQGAAQGLSEVLSGLGVERMESMLPEIIQNTSSSRAYVREGFISLLVFLPSVFGERFSPYLGRIIQPVLGGLADDSEYVREASMRAGRMIVANHSTKAIDLLLPELERGLFDSSWRIRLSSIQLVGELLFRISGISGKAELDDDVGNEEEEGTTYHSNSEAARKMLEVLGKEKRDRVLSGLYILRQDSAGQVRTFSIGVWKALVSHTPRTVREMLPSLMQIIVRLLATSGGEQQEAAARTLGELCRKQGERILGEIIPLLQQASSGSEYSRRGCCLAFVEMLEATSKVQLEGFEDAIIESVRGALVDESPAVRQAAAQAFDALQTQIGARSIDQTIPTLLGALTGEGGASEAALSALKELMSVRAHAIFPILIPTLIATPISSFNATALGSLVTVAGPSLNRRLAQILDALQKNKEVQEDETVKEDLESAIRSVLGSVSDSEGLHMLMLHLLGLAKDPRSVKRAGGCNLFATFCQVTEEDFSDYHVDWVRQLLSLYEETDEDIQQAAQQAWEAFSKTLSKDQMEAITVPLRRGIETTATPGSEVPGFCRTGGLKPILPILIQGLLAGTNEQREQSALGLGDIVERTAVDSLRPYVTQITGPLIRIIAERYPAPVKAAILSTLTVLLSRVPQFVRPFFPQLQRTFVKNLSEMSSSTIRTRAAAGLGVLMSLQPRIDPLIAELVNGATGHEEQEVRDAMAGALWQVVLSGGKNIGSAAREQVAEIVRNTLAEPLKEGYNNSIAKTLAGMVLHEMPQAEALVATLLEGRASTVSTTALLQCVELAPEQLYKINSPMKVTTRILKSVINEHTGISRTAREARDLMKKTSPWSEDEEVQAKVA